MLVLLIVEPKCTLATSHAAPGSQGEYADGTDTRHYAFRYGRCHRNITQVMLLDCSVAGTELHLQASVVLLVLHLVCVCVLKPRPQGL